MQRQTSYSYFSVLLPAVNLEEMIKSLVEALSKLQDENVITGADMNAHCVRRGYRTNNIRGYQVENFISEKNLHCLNSPGSEPTVQRYNAEEWSDLTLASNPTLKTCATGKSWKTNPSKIIIS
ncbi:hypothetical protein AVEN_86170-1 [Araneus ventricosus]|uniref:Endonuclease/exonuclease/phosphatase domain-containing protein n=1 Tax=Araneus ventricosus TaxID=182803 RepID=A0A4Y2DW00_ARAVE|nr:hypothetical protein AVEN_86170-1 [Araneus ventricosus]